MGGGNACNPPGCGPDRRTGKDRRSSAKGWVKGLDGWRITDAFAAHVVRPSAYAVTKPFEWAAREPLFERRAGFATIAQMAWAKNDDLGNWHAGRLQGLPFHKSDQQRASRRAPHFTLRGLAGC
jgi:hypothetical protein